MIKVKIRNRSKGNILFMILGTIFIMWGIIIQCFSNFNVGYLLTVLLGINLFIYGKFYENITKIIPSLIKKTIKFVILLAFIWMIFIFVYGKIDTVDYKEEAIIVLGAGLRGEKLSPNLKNRVDKGIEYLEKNLDAIAVVSGGQGHDEKVAESFAMKKYMIENGVSKDRIIEENKSTSTFENFLFSKEILDNYFDGKEYKIVYVTSDFHTFRSSILAKRAGIKKYNKKSSPLQWYMYPMTYLRETLACVNLIFNKNRIKN
ncbi:YdcF family protein [Fusobacterium sp. PH5-44]|uniref:YdcF family protein n=1 Tax=unclassified Fusobacterium TaxID=2648384 RepID=UPI003D19E7EC